MKCSIFKNIFSKDVFYISVKDALQRIIDGKSQKIVEEIQKTLDKEKASKLKCNLPSVCFSGTFGPDRTDSSLQKHSGFLVLDFDNVENLRDKQEDIINHKFVYACWVSPSGNGLKALVKIADGKKHREHFQALQEIFPDVDRSGINVSRVCYESYDPHLFLNEKCEVFKKTKKTEKIVVKEKVNEDEYKTFQKLLAWMSNRNDAFVTGERNNFIFKLSSACCRFGIQEQETERLISNEFLTNSEFSKTESNRAIKSAYRANSSRFGDCIFEKEMLVEKVSRSEAKIDATLFDESIRPKDVIYGIDVKDKALELYDSGYAVVNGIGVPDIDERFKLKRGELTLLTGIGNYGKTAFDKWYKVMRILLFGEKFATFSPEDNPPEEYYHDFVEILLGCDCTPSNPNRPSREVYEAAYDFITKHIFYVYPKDDAPTPEYIKERFLELVIKEKVDGVGIDPFNQLSNQYNKFQGRDKYLEYVLTDFSRFAQINNCYFQIIAHPIKMNKDGTGNYPCPDVYDVADGAMWNNKTDNILVYHRPMGQTDPQNPACEFHAKKIRRQKIVGKKGFSLFEMLFRTRRFFFNGGDPLQKILNEKNLTFAPPKAIQSTMDSNDKWLPMDGDISF